MLETLINDVIIRGQFHQRSTSSFLTCEDPKSAKKTVKLSVFFAHLGYEKSMMKLAHPEERVVHLKDK